jgi:hypothetical protein
MKITGQYIPKENLKSQSYLNQISNWTKDQKMIISKNFTKKYNFTTRLELENENIYIVDKMKILGWIITNTLSWNENCTLLIKNVNARMQVLRKVWIFGPSIPEMVHLWVVYCRSVLESSGIVWDSSLTQENIEDLEQTQKTFAKITLGKQYLN